LKDEVKAMRIRRAMVGIFAALGGWAALGAEEVWVGDIHDPTDGRAAGTPTVLLIVGARNGSFSGKIVVSSDKPVMSLQAQAGALRGPGGVIPSSAIRIRYGRPWEARNPRWQPGTGPLACLSETAPAEIAANSRGTVWATVRIPKDLKAGVYEGSLAISARGMAAKQIPLRVQVADWTLPDPVNYRTWVDIVEAPDTLALEYQVPLWSERHWALIERAFAQLGEVGNKTVYVPLIGHTNFGHEEAMVRWVRQGPDRYAYDYSVMDRYLDLAQRYLVRPSAVIFVVWEMYMIPRDSAIPEDELRKVRREDRPVEITEARQALEILQKGGELGLGPLVPVVSVPGRPPQNTRLPTYSAPESRALWGPLLSEIRRRVAARGWGDVMMFGVFSDSGATKEELAFFQDLAPGVPWVIQSHYGVGANATREYRGAPVAYDTRVWGAVRFADGQKQTNQRAPVTDRATYGWSRPDLVAIYERNSGLDGYPVARWRFFAETCITGDQRGVGRIGGDFWFCIRDRHGRRAGDAASRYPEASRRNLDLYSSILAAAPEGPAASNRFEAFREGVQECEARIAIEYALMDETRRRQLGDELAARAQKHLEDRLAYMWKSLSQEPEKGPVMWRWNPGVGGQRWFLQAGWQERSAQLYALAGEVETKVGKPMFGGR